MVVQVNDVGMELRAQDLRIGNLVSDCHTNSVMEVMEIKANSTRCSYTRIDNNQPHVSIVQNEWLKPIPLTEEVLLKIDGVEKSDNSEWGCLIKISASKLYFRFNSGHCYTQFNDTYLGDMISCLHQLQNFCHVFKKELNVKL